MFENSKTTLTEDCLLKCCNKALTLARDTSGIHFTIEASQKSQSKYIYVQIEDSCFYTLRVSDHYSPYKYWDRQIVIKPGTTKNNLVIKTIKNCIQIVQKKRLKFLLNSNKAKES
ncbi:MAG: hypothetical protein J6W64_08005 [Bacilli bacterium]|nr:hypothetical protein [Bacilli bacterium]